MMLGLLISLLWAAAVVLELIYLIILYWHKIVDFVRNRHYLVEDDKDRVAFSLQDKLSNGDYKTVYGIFDKVTNELVDGEQIQSDDIDEELETMHMTNELLILK